MMKWIVFFFLPMVCRWRLLSKPIARQMLAAAASQGGALNYDVSDAGYVLAAGRTDFSPVEDPLTTLDNLDVFWDLVGMGFVQHTSVRSNGLEGRWCRRPGVYLLTRRGWKAAAALRSGQGESR